MGDGWKDRHFFIHLIRELIVKTRYDYAIRREWSG